MRITLTKKAARNRMVCTRDDGSYTQSDLGPSLPFHDLAHYVVETTLNLKQGFYGHIASGYSPEQLGSSDVIKTLPIESWFAEVLARALGSLHSGACSTEQFPTLVNDEMRRFNHAESKTPSSAVATSLLREYQSLLDRWEALREGESLKLEFSLTSI
jgi:hypothetical protein